MSSRLRARSEGTEASQCKERGVLKHHLWIHYSTSHQVLVSGRTLWRRCCAWWQHWGWKAEHEKGYFVVSRSQRWGELLLNADNALPVSVVLDSSVRVVMWELRGGSGPATKTETDRGGGRKKTFVNPARRLINPNVHMHTCTGCMNPQESDEGERQYEAQMYGAEKHSVNKLPV